MALAPSVVLYGSAGEQFSLSPVTQAQSGSLWLMKGSTGLDMPPWDVAEVESPLFDGREAVHSRALQREIFLPMTIWGETRADIVRTKRRIISAMVPDLIGDRPRLLIAERLSESESEIAREATVRYVDGLEGDEGQDNGLTWMKFGLVLATDGDPLWRSTVEKDYPFTAVPEMVPFFPESGGFVADEIDPGFKLSGDPVFVDTIDVVNNGDVVAYPILRIVGPHAAGCAFTRAATARLPEASLGFVGLDLLEGEFLELFTEQGRVKLVSNKYTSEDLWAIVGNNPEFWALDKGTNTISIIGLDVGATAYVRFTERFASA